LQVLELTVATNIKVNDAAYAHIDHAQETLVLFLELFLVKDLNRQYTLIGCPPELLVSICLVSTPPVSPPDSHVKALVPVRVQSLLDHTSRSGLLATDSRHGERVGEACNQIVSVPVSGIPLREPPLTKDISLVQAISGNDCRAHISLHALPTGPCRCILAYW